MDAAYGRFDLTDAAGYRAFLVAHAHALPVAEARMALLPFARTLTPRTPLLSADLTALGVAMPKASSPTSDDMAAAWGTLYVVEGSRLGGALLARAVPPQWPSAYLGAIHPAGQWRAIQAAVDAAAEREPDVWRERMIAGALDTFALYAAAAER